MNKKRRSVSGIVLMVSCFLLILSVAALGIGLWEQHSRFAAEREQWAKKEKKYEKQLRKARKQREKEQADNTAAVERRCLTESTIAPPQYLENLDDSRAGEILEGENLDMENLSRYFSQYEIAEGDPVYQRINGKSYRENPDIGLEDLAYMKMLHYNFEGEIQVGELIMNERLADDILEIFQELFENQYQIQSMYLVDNYWTGDGIASDSASIDENNTSAFNYRQSVAGAESSNHAYGRAIDINPLQNPYIWLNEDGTPDGAFRNDRYNNRELGEPHMIDHSDLCYQLFLEHGFTWGGDWVNPVDYQHFEKREN